MSDGYVITKSSEDNYDGFARAMGDDPAANKNYSCDFYDRDYMTALQEQLVSRVMDYPVRAALSSHPFSSATLPQTELLRSLSSNES